MRAAFEFKELLQARWNSGVRGNLANQNVLWQFNPTGAPLFGDLLKKSVNSSKKAMYKVFGLLLHHLIDNLLVTTISFVEQSD